MLVVRSSGPAGLSDEPDCHVARRCQHDRRYGYLLSGRSPRDSPVLSSAGTQIGTLEHVLEVPEVDVFDGIVIATQAGLRFIDADYVQRITRSCIWSSLDDADPGPVAAT